MALLKHAETLELSRAALGLLGTRYTGVVRSNLLMGIPSTYVGGLEMTPAPADQLLSDLRRFNNDVRVRGGVVPLATWLANVVAQNDADPRADALRRFKSVIAGEVSGAAAVPPVPDAANVRPEAAIGRDETLPFEFLTGGIRVGGAVARLEVPVHLDGVAVTGSDGSPELALGTGWLLSPDLLVTNHHVVNAREKGKAPASAADLEAQAKATEATFDFDSSTSATQKSGVQKLEISNDGLDFAVLRLSAPVDRPLPSFRESAITMSPDHPFPVNIIQHPRGESKRIAVRNNLLFRMDDDHLYYKTDTDEGASGSPVLDDGWQIIGIHRAARFERGPNAVLPVINEGIRWSAIRDRIHAAGRGELLP